MALTPSTMLPLGTLAPDFTLPDPSGALHSLDDAEGSPAVLVAFLCNHCPFVVHVKDGLAELGRYCEERGVAMFGVNSNDADRYPADAPERMSIKAAEWGWTFPYLYDETQDIAKAYGAACAPDFFLFDAAGRLVYRGQMDDSRPSSQIPVTGADLKAAIDATVAGAPAPEPQKPSMGCNIKWRPGNEPPYFG